MLDASATEITVPLAHDAAFENRLHQVSRWQVKTARLLFLTDLTAVACAVVLAFYARFILNDGVTGEVNYPAFAVGLTIAWVSLLWAFRCYEHRLLGVGTEEFRRVVATTFALFGVIAIVAYSFKLELARGFIAVALPVGVCLLLLSRYLVRLEIRAKRAQGRLIHRVLVVGNHKRAAQLADQLARDPHAGFQLMGVAVPDGEAGRRDDWMPVLGTLDSVLSIVRSHAIDTIALTASPEVTPDFVRQLSWSLEGSGIDLVMAPALTDVAGPRISIRPVAGLPLMYVDEPTFSGWTRFVKRTIDLVGSSLGLLVLSPLLISVAAAIRLTSRGPAIFRQERIGADGSTFVIWKFRTMQQGADLRLSAVLATHGQSVAPLFKVQHDPRVTRIGNVLRRYSIDELPQLVNVLRGQMSLVGPRPQRQEEVEQYSDADRRRLLSRPGMTGLWQVSGRSGTNWNEAVRLDLYYVENWSLALDVTILLRTVLAVFRGEGAY